MILLTIKKKIYIIHTFFLNDRQTVETKHTGQFLAMEKRIVSWAKKDYLRPWGCPFSVWKLVLMAAKGPWRSKSQKFLFQLYSSAKSI